MLISLLYIHPQEESFKVIVQKNALYQTGADKQIPVMCVADLGDLTVSNSIIAT
ncbi:hypothetical protein DPMN_187472 [Dreissena polymorpha]|uniref:Uncharacterized protein n=1 Tax=Dreissena polymorpha TaxID=45954 RepID=A0A9D4I7J1_DREPO|nr:hypothetical protein DPMN_187472 [Dreissena polymorpha]